MILLVISMLTIISYSLGEEWTIHVYTGNERFAGTDSNVFIRLYNSEHGYSHEYELTHDNWIFGRYEFPLKNLFEYGAHDRFRIFTEKITTVKMIHVRLEIFPVLQSDWYLDRIVVERNRDSIKFTFSCQCWLGKKRPDITIPALSDLQSNDENTLLKKTLIIVIILIVPVALITCIICCIHEYCRCRGFSTVQTQQESSVLDRYHPQLPQPSAPLLLNDNIWPRETIRNSLLSDNATSLVIFQPTTDEPPAYTDLFPN